MALYQITLKDGRTCRKEGTSHEDALKKCFKNQACTVQECYHTAQPDAQVQGMRVTKWYKIRKEGMPITKQLKKRTGRVDYAEVKVGDVLMHRETGYDGFVGKVKVIDVGMWSETERMLTVVDATNTKMYIPESFGVLYWS